jgi:hypothetical protein
VQIAGVVLFLLILVIPTHSQTVTFTELPISALYCASRAEDDLALCQHNVQRMETDNKKAWHGDYQGQRNVAYCLGYGCDGLVFINKSLGCAWRIIIIGSGSPRVDNTDISNIKLDCGRLNAAENSAAHAQAEAIFRAVYGRELPPVFW